PHSRLGSDRALPAPCPPRAALSDVCAPIRGGRRRRHWRAYRFHAATYGLFLSRPRPARHAQYRLPRPDALARLGLRQSGLRLRLLERQRPRASAEPCRIFVFLRQPPAERANLTFHAPKVPKLAHPPDHSHPFGRTA